MYEIVKNLNSTFICAQCIIARKDLFDRPNEKLYVTPEKSNNINLNLLYAAMINDKNDCINLSHLYVFQITGYANEFH